MGFGDFLYSVGEVVESCIRWALGIVRPEPSEEPPSFKYLRRLVKRNLTVHEFLSLKLQVMFLAYLIMSLGLVILNVSALWLLLLGLLYLLYLRYVIVRNWEFFIDPVPYRFFYYTISLISLLAFLGYALLRKVATSIYYYYGYLLAVFLLVMGFRWYFKQRYGREYTYGTVEEIKGEAVKVFVHDDIAANVKPGYYWVDAVEDLKVGRVVKLLVEDRRFRGAVPTRILEVYFEEPPIQSSHTETKPKEETE